MIVAESGTTKKTHLAPLYHPDALVNPDTYRVRHHLILIASYLQTNFTNLTSKLESIETKIETFSEKLEENQEALIQKLNTNQDDLTSKMDNMQDLIETQDQKLDNVTNNLTNRLDSIQDLMTNQANTIERQNEVIARQTEMLSFLISRTNETIVEDCFVQCSLTIDDRIDSVSYNGLELPVSGDLNNYGAENTFSFNSCVRYRPGQLTIKGFDATLGGNCVYGGLVLHCIANDISNPWHNFVTDQTHWKVSDGSTPCTHDHEWGPQTADFFKKMIDAGAIKIWSNAQSVTLIGTPDNF